MTCSVCPPRAGRPSGPQRSSTDRARAGDGYTLALSSRDMAPRPPRGAREHPAHRGVARGYTRPPPVPTQPPSRGRDESIRHFLFQSLRLQAALSREHPALGLEPAAGIGPVGSGAPRNAGRPGAAPLPTQSFPRPSPLAQSPRRSPGDPEGGPVAHWRALPGPAPAQGARLPALESPPQSPGLCSPATDKPCPCPWWGPVHPEGPPATSPGSTRGAWAACLSAGPRAWVHPLQVQRWDSRGGAECARAPALSSLRAPLLPRRLLLSQQEEWAMPGWTSLGPSQLLRGGQAGHDPLGC